jgi:uncharacterized membrane protein YtjA (UPF0391 family)
MAENGTAWNVRALTPRAGRHTSLEKTDRMPIMLGWVLIFLVLALVAAVLGFGGIAGAFTNIAMILFWIFLILFIISLVFRLVRGGPSPRL